MQTKTNRIPARGAIAISLMAVCLLAVPTASASIADSGFGVSSVNSDDPTITGYMGSALLQDGAPGDGETPGGEVPGDGEIPGGGEGVEPVVCYSGQDPAGGFKATNIQPAGQSFPSPQYISAQSASGFSPWVDEILAADGSFDFGTPRVTIDRVVVDGRTLTDVDISDLVNLSGASAVPAGTISKSTLPAWWPESEKSVVDYGLIKLDRPMPIQTELFAMVESSDFRDQIGASSGAYIEATDLTVSYPLTIEWNDASGTCQEKAVDFSFGYHFGAE